MFLCHGVGEHSGRYLRFVGQLLEARIGVVRLDLRGHGQSPGRRGDVHDFAEYADDLHAVLTHFAETLPRAPSFLFGHSMGAVVATLYLLFHSSPPFPLHGLLLSSPGFVPKVPIGSAKTLLSRLLLPVAPWLRFSTGIRPEHLSADPEAQRAFVNDPYTYSKVSVRWYAAFQRACSECLQRAQELTTPLYVCVGADDPVVSCDGARVFVERTSSDDKTLRTYDGMRHEPLNEKDSNLVAAAIIEWILSHTGARI